MKTKITISIDENLLLKIDHLVWQKYEKNRSQVIEKVLQEKFGEKIDMTAIVFAHDYKWDDSKYGFSIPKALLEIKNRTIITRQIEMFVETWVRFVRILIPKWDKKYFSKEIKWKYIGIDIKLIEVDPSLKTWSALKEAIKEPIVTEYIMITNGDIYAPKLDLKDYFEYHKSQNSNFSFCLKYILSNPEKLWNITINWNKISEFIEKPLLKNSYKYLTNAWFYITDKQFLSSIKIWDYLEYDTFPDMLEKWNVIWYIYSWEWEHIQDNIAYERANWWQL